MVGNPSRSAVSGIYSNISAATAERPSLDILKVVKLENNDAIVTFRTDGRNVSEAGYSASFSSITNKGKLVSGSIYPIDNSRKLFKAVIAATKKSAPFNQETVAANKLSVVTANVFKDEDDNIWKVHGEGDAQFIVQEASEDFTSILREQRNRNGVIVANLNNDGDYTPGDFVSYYDRDEREVRQGFVVNPEGDTIEVFTPNQVTKQVEKAAIMAAIEPDSDMVAVINEIRSAGRDMSMAYINYLKDLYNGSNDWIKAYEAAIRKLAVA